MTKTTNYQLNQWAKSDRVMMDDFNADNATLDAALKANADAIAAETTARVAGDALVKLVDLTLQEETQKWDIDLSGIDLSEYQKLIVCPHLRGNTNQWAYIHFDNTSTEYGNVPMINEPTRQNFGVCEYTVLLELPNLYLLQMGITSNSTTVTPGLSGKRGPTLDSGVTHLSTLGFWFGSASYHLLENSTVQIYGLKK